MEQIIVLGTGGLGPDVVARLAVVDAAGESESPRARRLEGPGA